MLQVPLYVSILFICTTIVTIGIFFLASNRSKKALFISIIWLIVQLIISLTGFYTVSDTLPPRFVLLIGPPLVLIMFIFFTGSGRKFLDRLNIRTLTYIHVIRIPVEICLLILFIYKTIPELMTFEGRNFDILSGITAPLVAFFVFRRIKTRYIILLIWNFICLGLLINIVVHAALSTPTVIQKFAFDQPNIAIFYFPFVWLPSYIVPVVLLSHLASIKQLISKMREKKEP